MSCAIMHMYNIILKYFIKSYELSLWPWIIPIAASTISITYAKSSSLDQSMSITYAKPPSKIISLTLISIAKLIAWMVVASFVSSECELLFLCNSMLQWVTYYHFESKLLLLLCSLKIAPSNFILKDNSWGCCYLC